MVILSLWGFNSEPQTGRKIGIVVGHFDITCRFHEYFKKISLCGTIAVERALCNQFLEGIAGRAVPVHRAVSWYRSVLFFS
jgi:hypothetical protein